MAESVAEEVNIKIKLGSDKNIELKIKNSWTVLELKQEIEKQNQSKPSEMKIIYKGRILKDTDPLSTYKIAEGSTMHLVVSKPQQATTQQPSQSSTSSQQQPQQQQQGSSNNVPPQMATGGANNPLGMMGGLQGLDLGALGGGMEPQQMQQMLSNPMVQQMMNNLMTNPQLMNNMIQNNPMLNQMMQSNPQMQELINNPELMQNAMNMIGNNPNLLGSGLGGSGGNTGASSSQQSTSNNTGSSQQQGQGQGQGQQPDIMSLLQNNPMFQGMDLSALGGLQGLQGLGGLGGQGQQDNRPPEEKYATQLSQMEAMGFTNKEINIQALQATGGNVEAAVERVLNMIG